jgi:hypothetical protein
MGRGWSLGCLVIARRGGAAHHNTTRTTTSRSLGRRSLAFLLFFCHHATKRICQVLVRQYRYNTLAAPNQTMSDNAKDERDNASGFWFLVDGYLPRGSPQ